MKTIKEIRNQFKLHPTEIASSIKYLAKMKIDYDVFLPSINKNLQRDFVWTLDQKREIINSILIGRHIPHIAVVDICDHESKVDSIYQIIDGKQRLSSIIDFYNNKFPIIIDLFKDLPEDYQICISTQHLRIYRVVEEGVKISDQDKINWFKFINFAGTPQDGEHFNNLK